MRTILAGLALALLSAPAAFADDAPGKAEASTDAHYNLLGPARCEQWPKSGSITSAQKAVPLNWALGYFGGVAGDDKLALLDMATPEAVDQWLTSYCHDHPKENLPLAIKLMAKDLEAKLPPSAAAAAPQPPMFVPPTVVAPRPAAAAAKPTTKKKAAKAKTPSPAPSGN